jgi:hypothetical protein
MYSNFGNLQLTKKTGKLDKNNINQCVAFFSSEFSVNYTNITEKPDSPVRIPLQTYWSGLNSSASF